MTDQEAWCAACHMMKYGMVKFSTFDETKTYCQLVLNDDMGGERFISSGFTENAALRGLYDQFLEMFPYGG